MNKGTHPQIVLDEGFKFIDSLSTPENITHILQSTLNFTYSPPDHTCFIRAIKFISTINLLLTDNFNYMDSINFLKQGIDEKYTPAPFGSSHPIWYAHHKFNRVNTLNGNIKNEIWRLFIKFSGDIPKEGNSFAKDSYYSHVIALRDVFVKFLKAHEKLNDSHYLIHNLDNYIQDQISYFENTTIIDQHITYINKLYLAKDILNGKRICGEIFIKSSKKIRNKKLEKNNIRIDKSVHDEINERINLEDGSFFEINDNSDELVTDKSHGTKSSLEKYHTIRAVEQGFGRTNVVTGAELSLLGEATLCNYMHYLYEVDKDAYYIVWLVLITGISIERLKKISFSFLGNIKNKNSDSVFLDKSQNSLFYPVIRRKEVIKDQYFYETCGIRIIYLPHTVNIHFSNLIKDNKIIAIIKKTDTHAKTFCKNSSGLSPTLARIRSSSKYFLHTNNFSCLECSINSGDISISLKAISHYYRYQNNIINQKLTAASNAILKKWNLPDPAWGANKATAEYNEIGSKTPGSVELLRGIIKSIELIYTKLKDKLKTLRPDERLERFIVAANIHECSIYILQLFMLGLRPIGKSARLVATDDNYGVAKKDKDSIFYRERSFSPITNIHSNLLSVSKHNFNYLKHLSDAHGLAINKKNDPQRLATKYELEKNNIIIKTMESSEFNNIIKLLMLDKIMPQENNWPRHCSANILSGEVPQCLIDQLLGHRRSGRDICSPWSSEGGNSFKTITEYLSSLEILSENSQLLSPA